MTLLAKICKLIIAAMVIVQVTVLTVRFTKLNRHSYQGNEAKLHAKKDDMIIDNKRLSRSITDCEKKINALNYCMFEKLNGKNIRNPIKKNDYVLLYSANDLTTLQEEKNQQTTLRSQLQEKENLLLRQTSFSGNIKIL